VNRSLGMAWLAGEAIVIWRMVHKDHRPPVPGALLGISALFLVMALAADMVPKAAGLIALTAWGLDVAALMNALPAGLAGQLAQAGAASGQAEGVGSGSQATGTTQAPGTSTAGGRG
jgi:hypothetical protein